jgi:hypothetical protein
MVSAVVIYQHSRTLVIIVTYLSLLMPSYNSTMNEFAGWAKGSNCKSVQFCLLAQVRGGQESHFLVPHKIGANFDQMRGWQLR